MKYFYFIAGLAILSFLLSLLTKSVSGKTTNSLATAANPTGNDSATDLGYDPASGESPEQFIEDYWNYMKVNPND